MTIFVRKITNWSYGDFIMIPIMGVREGVLSGVGISKNRQITTVKKP